MNGVLTGAERHGRDAVLDQPIRVKAGDLVSAKLFNDMLIRLEALERIVARISQVDHQILAVHRNQNDHESRLAAIEGKSTTSAASAE